MSLSGFFSILEKLIDISILPLHSFRILIAAISLGIFLLPVSLLGQIETDVQHVPGELKIDSIEVDTVQILEISLKGNKKTRPHIILREIGFEAGTRVARNVLMNQLPWIKYRIFNTGLFLSVSIQLKKIDSTFVTLAIEVKERFYTYPIPTVSLADRNFNEWWETRDHDFRRLDIGMYIKQKNLRGRNETLKVKFTVGFNKKLEVQYQFPYINKKLKTGLTIYSGIIANRQIAPRTWEDKLEYFELKKNLRTRVTGGFYFTRRNNFYLTHQAGINYLYTEVADTIAAINANYFLDSATAQHSTSFRYSFVWDKRDFAKYSLKGYYVMFENESYWFKTNKSEHFSNQARIEGAHYFQLSKRWFWANGIRMKYCLPNDIGYYNQKAFGYKEDYVSGYQLYVIDGTQFYLAKSHLKWRILSWSVENMFMPVKEFKQTPFALYFKILAEAGYVNQPSLLSAGNSLGNTVLYGYGIGLDCTTYYDIVGRIDFTVNHLQQAGVYLHLKAAF